MTADARLLGNKSGVFASRLLGNTNTVKVDLAPEGPVHARAVTKVSSPNAAQPPNLVQSVAAGLPSNPIGQSYIFTCR
jgi:hypothetical protein